MKRGDVAYVVDGTGKFITGIATDCVRSTRKGVSRAGQKMAAAWALSCIGLSTSVKGRVLLGTSLVATGVATVVSSPVIAKTALVISGAAFCGGMVSGFREAMKQISDEEKLS